MERRSLTNNDYRIISILLVHKDGHIFNKVSGRKYGSLMKVGYIVSCLKISDECMIRDYNHRFIFLLVNGYLPHHIDHIDQDKGNNLPTNLRAATSQENAFNCKLSKNNTSGVNGVYYENSRNKWVGKIKINYRNVDLKRFHSFEEAVKHRRYLEVKYEFNM